MPLVSDFNSDFNSDFGTRKHAQALIVPNDKGPDPQYQSGDPLVVWNNRRIRQVHAEHICHPRVDGLKVKGLACNGYPMLRKMLELTKQYQYERQSTNEVLRTNLRTSEEDTMSPTATDPKLRMQVAQTCEAAVAAGSKRVCFGTLENLVWFGGRTYVADSDLEAVWTQIETLSAHRERDFISIPWGRADGFAFLAITLTNMSDERANELVMPDIDDTDPENPITIRRRRFKIPWEDLAEMKGHVDDVKNAEKFTDLRNLREYVEVNEVVDKLA